MDTNTNSPVTCICSDQQGIKTFVAGFAEGSIKMFDQRLEEEESIIRTFSEHTSWIQKIRPNPTNSHQFLSASLDGEVKLWDLRSSHRGSIEKWHFNNGLAAFDAHSLADIFAV
jgi:regulatory associated protein of mTOR